MSQTRLSKTLFAIAALMVVLGGPAVASAQEEGDVLVLLTEIVEEDVAGEREIRFWWSGTDQPEWTDTDREVFSGLREGGVEPLEPGSVDISRIYRRPGLSVDNASQIGALLDARRVLVGTVEYRTVESIPPLNYPGIEARAEVDLVPAGGSDAVSVDRFSVTRRVYRGETDSLLEEARRRTGRALGEVMGRTLRRARGQIGLELDRELLAFRDAGRAEYLEAVRRRLTELEDVETVVERWATEGLVALEVVPTGGDRQEVFEYARRVVANHEFENFELVPSDDPLVEGTTEFRIESGSGAP